MSTFYYSLIVEYSEDDTDKILIDNISHLNATILSNIEVDIVINNDEDRNYYSTIEHIYSNDTLNKYLIEECNKKFDIEFLNTGNIIINNVEYKEKDFLEIVAHQDKRY